MIKPGLFRHYKSTSSSPKLYRVLFMAPWWSGQDQLKADDLLEVVAYDDSVGVRWEGMQAGGDPVFTARWSGNDNARLDMDEPIVIYVALYDDGRVAARPLKEFEERIAVDGFSSKDVERFKRIGD